MNWIDYREKLGIGFNDEEKVKYFMRKIFNCLYTIKDRMNVEMNFQEYFTFCNMTGTPIEQNVWDYEIYSLILSVLEKRSKNFKDFVAYYVAFINCQTDDSQKAWSKEDLKNILCNMLAQSGIEYDLVEEEGNFFLFPKGAKELDDALVTDTLLWLKEYPLAHKAWSNALKDYSESNEHTASETADKFRKALERFFQEFFDSEKSLENLKSEYGTYLSSKGVPSELKNNFEKLLESYTNYINNYAKHHDKVSSNVLEYIMYQTGNIMRLLITLEKE